MTRSATEQFLTGRKAKVRTDWLGCTYLVVGPHPRRSGWMRLQYADTGRFAAARTGEIIPLPTADEVGWDVISDSLPPHG